MTANFLLLRSRKLDEFNAAEHTGHARTDKAEACLGKPVKSEMSRVCVPGQSPRFGRWNQIEANNVVIKMGRFIEVRDDGA